MTPHFAFALVGGFGMFLFGMKTMSEALQVFAADHIRRLIGRAADDRLAGVGSGVLVSTLVQSSALTTVMAISFVNAGLMTLPQAAGVILGANLGTTSTGWLLAVPIQTSALPLLGVGALLNLFARREVLKFAGELAMGVGLLFFGLFLFERGAAALRDMPVLADGLAGFGAGGMGGVIAAACVAALLAALVKSSSVMIGVIIALGAAGLISFRGAAALVLGANAGAAVTALRAAVGTTAESRRAAVFHVAVNTLGAVGVLCVFPLWVGAIDALTPGDPGLAGAHGLRPSFGLHVAVAHTSFNLLLVAGALPLLRPLVQLTERAVRGAPTRRTSLQFLRQSMFESPALAIEQCRLEVLHLAAIAGETLDLTRQLFRDLATPQREVRDALLKRERATDRMQHEITMYMSRVMGGMLTAAQSEEIRGLVRVAHEIETVADYCERLANYRRRMVREQVVFSPAAVQDLQGYLERTIAFYEEIVDRARRAETGWLPAVHTKGEYLATEADALRDANLQRLATQRCDPTAAIFFNDMVVSMRRIRNHAVNMAEAFLGQK